MFVVPASAVLQFIEYVNDGGGEREVEAVRRLNETLYSRSALFVRATVEAKTQLRAGLVLAGGEGVEDIVEPASLLLAQTNVVAQRRRRDAWWRSRVRRHRDRLHAQRLRSRRHPFMVPVLTAAPTLSVTIPNLVPQTH